MSSGGGSVLSLLVGVCVWGGGEALPSSMLQWSCFPHLEAMLGYAMTLELSTPSLLLTDDICSRALQISSSEPPAQGRDP